MMPLTTSTHHLPDARSSSVRSPALSVTAAMTLSFGTVIVCSLTSAIGDLDHRRAPTDGRHPRRVNVPRPSGADRRSPRALHPGRVTTSGVGRPYGRLGRSPRDAAPLGARMTKAAAQQTIDGDEAAARPALSDAQLSELLVLLKGVDSAELKMSVPEEFQRSTVAALGMDPLDAEIRQVAFFDTPDLDLDRHGLVVRARRVQRKPGDVVVKLRPIVPDALPAALRRAPGFGIEVDAMPGGFVCSAAMQAEAASDDVRAVLAGRRSIRKLCTKAQRALFADRAPDGVALDDLSVLGPV